MDEPFLPSDVALSAQSSAETPQMQQPTIRIDEHASSLTARLTLFYAKFGEKKEQHQVDSIAQRYEGNEKELNKNLRKKYGHDLRLVNPVQMDEHASSLTSRLTLFYAKVAPGETHQVDSIAQRYEGNEKELNENLRKKYGHDLRLVDPVVFAEDFDFDDEFEDQGSVSQTCCCTHNAIQATPNGVELRQRRFCCPGRVCLLSEDKDLILRESINTVNKGTYSFVWPFLFAAFFLTLSVIMFINAKACVPDYYYDETVCLYDPTVTTYGGISLLVFLVLFLTGIYLYSFKPTSLTISLRRGNGILGLLPYRQWYFFPKEEAAYQIVHESVMTKDPLNPTTARQLL